MFAFPHAANGTTGLNSNSKPPSSLSQCETLTSLRKFSDISAAVGSVACELRSCAFPDACAGLAGGAVCAPSGTAHGASTTTIRTVRVIGFSRPGVHDQVDRGRLQPDWS